MLFLIQVLFLLLLVYLIWKVFIEFLVQYLIAGFRLGFRNIDIIYRPLSTYNYFYKQGLKFNHSFGILYQRVKKNPDIKIIFIRIFGITQLNIIDPQFIKKISLDFVSNLNKRQFLIFRDEIKLGLLYSEGDHWKNSRKLLSNLFHFEVLKSRQEIMESTIITKIQKLNVNKPDIFKLGRTIAGQIVLKSLFGQDFYNVKFDEKNPYDQINQIMMQLIMVSRELPHIIRMALGLKATRNSIFINTKQKEVLMRLLKFKQKSKQYVRSQQEKYKSGLQVSGFLKAYFQSKSPNYLQEAVQQLYIFLIAGQDTTGALISFCLLYLALYPKYQQIILQDVNNLGVHASKQLNGFINQINRKCVPLRDSAGRKVVEPFEIDGYLFNSGTFITISYAHAMNNIKFWDDPQEFIPQRFNSPLQYPLAFTPFSSGPRNCIGQHMALMEVRLTIVMILKKYKLEADGDNMMGVVNRGVVSVPANLKGVKFICK